MEFEVLDWPPNGSKVRLDHESFAYAGKFVMTDTGKAVAREGETVVGAASFSPDRTDGATLRIRYVTVRRDRRGEGIGPRLLAGLRVRALDRPEYTRLAIGVNNPYAFEALHRAGFGFTGETTGLAELVLAAPPDSPRESGYTAGLERFARRELTDAERSFVRDRLDTDPPASIEPPPIAVPES